MQPASSSSSSNSLRGVHLDSNTSVDVFVGSTLVFLFDCDGVLFRGNTAVPNASAALQRLQEEGKRVYFVTNNATKSRADNAEKLLQLGIAASPQQVICSAFSAARYCVHRGWKNIHVVGESGLRDELTEAGMKVFDVTNPCPEGGACDAVVCGLDRHFSYDKMAAALLEIQKGADFVASNRDATYPGEGGRMYPGAGSVVASIETCSGKKPFNCGKPSAWFVELVKSLVGVDSDLHEVVMVGDRLDTDVAFGLSAGFMTLLVTATGVHDVRKMMEADELSRPHFHVPSVAHLAKSKE